MSNEERINKILEEIVPCQDCGGYVSDHNGVQGDCNYEAGTEIVDRAKAELTKLIDEETTKARIDEVERFIVEPGEVIPYNNNTFADGFRYVVDKLQTRLTQLKERENSNTTTRSKA